MLLMHLLVLCDVTVFLWFRTFIHIMALFVTLEIGDVTQVFADPVTASSGCIN